MFIEYFGFKHSPFSLALADEASINMDPHKQVLCKQILNDLHNAYSPVVLTGDTGAGKTQILQYLSTRLPFDIQQLTLIDSALHYAARVLMSIDLFSENNQHTKKLLLIVDDAHEIPEADLKVLLLLSKQRTEKNQSFQLLLSGNNSLVEKLTVIDAKKYRDYAYQYHVGGLNEIEVNGYINVHLENAGYAVAERGEIFTPEAIKKIAVVSRGIPSLINVLADASLTLACREQLTAVSERLVKDAAKLNFVPLATIDRRITPIHSDELSFVKGAKRITIRVRWIKNQQDIVQYQQSYPKLLNLNQPRAVIGSQIIRPQPTPFKDWRIVTASLMAVSLCVLGVRSVKSQQGHSFLNTNVERLVSRFPIVWSQPEQTEVTQLTDIADVKPEIKASEIIQSVSVTPVVPVIIKQEPLPVVSAVKPNEQISRALVQVDDKPIKNRLVAVSSVNHFVPKKKIEYKQRLIQAEPPRISQKVMPEIHPHSQENSVSVANIKNNQPLTHTKKIVAQPILAHVELPKPMPLQHTQELPKHIAKVGSIDRQSVWRDKAPVMAQIKPSSAWVDEQEAAARDRAASRLRLSRLGVEFNEDSLINAAQKGDLKVVKLLIDGGIPRNIKNHSGQTALMASAKNGHKHIIKELLKPKRSL